MRDRRDLPEEQPAPLRTRPVRGGIVSEYYLGEPPLQWRFPARNRIIAGLSEALVVVEAPEKSGAVIVARHVLEAGGDVWAMPGPFAFAKSRGSKALLADGAEMLWGIDRFVDEVAPEPAPQRLTMAKEARAQTIPAELPDKKAAALIGIDFRPTEVDAIAGHSGLEIRELLSALSLLELKGYVTRDTGGAFVRNPIAGGPAGRPR